MFEVSGLKRVPVFSVEGGKGGKKVYSFKSAKLWDFIVKSPGWVLRRSGLSNFSD